MLSYIFNICMLSVFTAFLMVLAAGIFFSDLLLHPETLSYRETFRREMMAGKIKDQYERLKWEEVYIASPFGYRLHGVFFPLSGSKRAVIIFHGLTWSLHGSVKYVDMFLRLGFNVLLCDHRYHGKSGGSNITYGLYEKYDVKAWVNWLHEKFGSDCLAGVMGESLGASVALLTCAIDSRIAFCIADCPFSDLEALLKYHLKRYTPLPIGLILKLTGIMARIRAGFRYEAASVKRIAGLIKTPVMLVHGRNDSYIPKEMSIELYNLLGCVKKLYLAPRSGHVESYWKNREEYENLVYEFLLELKIITPLSTASGEN